MTLGQEIFNGDSITITQVARERNLDPSTILRWVMKGLPTPADGRVRIRLEASMLGSKWVTSRAALARFADALAAPPPVSQPTIIRQPDRRTRQSARAAEVLKNQFQIG